MSELSGGNPSLRREETSNEIYVVLLAAALDTSRKRLASEVEAAWRWQTVVSKSVRSFFCTTRVHLHYMLFEGCDDRSSIAA